MNQKVDVKISEDSFMETFNRIMSYRHPFNQFDWEKEEDFVDENWRTGDKIEIVEFAIPDNYKNEDGSIYKCLQKDSVSYFVEVKGRKIRIYISPKMRAKIMFENIGENVKND